MAERVDLAEVRALLANATSGPWGVTQDNGRGIGANIGPGPNGQGVMWRVVVDGEVDADDCDDAPLPPTTPVGVLKPADAALIAAAPEKLAALADEAEQLRGQVERVRELCERHAAMAPADDWGPDMATTVMADMARAVLAALSPPDDRPVPAVRGDL